MSDEKDAKILEELQAVIISHEMTPYAIALMFLVIGATYAERADMTFDGVMNVILKGYGVEGVVECHSKEEFDKLYREYEGEKDAIQQ